MKPPRGLYYAAKFQLAKFDRAPILLSDDKMYDVTDEIYKLFPDIELDDFDDDQQRQEQDYLTSIATRRYTTDNLQQTRHKLSQLIEQYERAAVVVPRAAPPPPVVRKREERPAQSASDNIVCERITSRGFFEVYLDNVLEGGGVSVSSGLFGELFQVSDEPILKLQTQMHICFARPIPREYGDDDDRQRIGLSKTVYDVLEKPLMLKEISLCHGFPLIGKVAVSGGEMDLDAVSEEVSKLQVLFIGLPLFGKRLFISKLYNALDGSEMDVGKIPLGETEIPIEVVTPSIDGRMRFMGRKKINWF